MLSTTARRSSAITSALALVALLVAACGGGPEPDRDGSAHPVSTPARPHFAEAPPGPPPRGRDGELSPLDVNAPQLANLDPDLLEAVQQAYDDASADGVEFWVTSGWRSREDQQRLLDEAVDEYGSLEEALKYVATPDKSAHVSGDAVDIGPVDADSWLMQHGADYGLCQTFANEIWHFELAVSPGEECPQALPDGTYR